MPHIRIKIRLGWSPIAESKLGSESKLCQTIGGCPGDSRPALGILKPEKGITKDSSPKTHSTQSADNLAFFYWFYNWKIATCYLAPPDERLRADDACRRLSQVLPAAHKSGVESVRGLFDSVHSPTKSAQSVRESVCITEFPRRHVRADDRSAWNPIRMQRLAGSAEWVARV